MIINKYINVVKGIIHIHKIYMSNGYLSKKREIKSVITDGSDKTDEIFCCFYTLLFIVLKYMGYLTSELM